MAPKQACAVFSNARMAPEQAWAVFSNAPVGCKQACAVFSNAQMAPEQACMVFSRVFTCFLGQALGELSSQGSKSPQARCVKIRIDILAREYPFSPEGNGQSEMAQGYAEAETVF